MSDEAQAMEDATASGPNYPTCQKLMQWADGQISRCGHERPCPKHGNVL